MKIGYLKKRHTGDVQHETKMHNQLYKIIFDSNLVPNADIKMHVKAIERGDYSLTDLLENAKKFYSFDQYAHESMLMDSM